MLKNVILLGVLTWVSLTYAGKDTVVQDTMADAETYRIEKPAHEHEAKRSVAGGKIKKKKAAAVSDEAPKAEPTETDSEVRYWQYSE